MSTTGTVSESTGRSLRVVPLRWAVVSLLIFGIFNAGGFWQLQRDRDVARDRECDVMLALRERLAAKVAGDHDVRLRLIGGDPIPIPVPENADPGLRATIEGVNARALANRRTTLEILNMEHDRQAADVASIRCAAD